MASDDVKHSVYPDANSMPQPQPAYNPHQQNMGSPPPPPPQPATVVYVADCSTFGPRSVAMTCPHCHQHIHSQVNYTSGLLSWLICGGCLLFGCWLGCCLIPFCVDDCKDAEHFCPNCKAYLGQYKRIG
ncbi:hypothetical protein FO519_002648 [Halicephalobus sp. NKZ332]|nr:hypothetical protein FO519_002648 [Halicephalobus sp. NKZ332]